MPAVKDILNGSICLHFCPHERCGETETVAFDDRLFCCWLAAVYDGAVPDAVEFHHHECDPVLGRWRLVQRGTRCSQQHRIEKNEFGLK